MQVVANGPHHHFPGVEAHAHAQSQAVGAAHLLRVGTHGGLHGQSDVAGPQGVVFVGNRGAEQGHNAITERLVDGALEAVHRVHHGVDSGIEEVLGGFRVEDPDEFRRVFEVGKQHRDRGGAPAKTVGLSLWLHEGTGLPACPPPPCLPPPCLPARASGLWMRVRVKGSPASP